jgi:phage gp36-like protein
VSYCTSSDISSEFKDITFGASTSITSTDIGNFCDQASAMIDSILSSKYVVPITGTASLLLIQMICIWLVKARVISILSVKSPVDKAKQDPDSQKLYEQAMALLKQIKSGVIQLTDAVAASTDDGLTSYLMNEDIEYTFTMESDAW